MMCVRLWVLVPKRMQTSSVQLTPSLVSQWYKLRARQLERDCGLVDAALDLLKLARERNVPVSANWVH